MRIRRFLAGAALLLLALFEISFFPAQAFRKGLRNLAGVPSRLQSSGFAFDPGYGAFLYAIAASTPPTASVAIAFPERCELCVYQAAYTLAPRRVLAFNGNSEAQYVAIYRSPAPAGYRSVRALPNGVLARQ